MRKTSGLSLMLLIFLSLCLMTFSLLSLSGATADERLSRKSADRTTEYYAAETAANGLVANIDAQLAGYLREAVSASAPADTWISLCAGLPELMPELVWSEAPEPTLSFSVAVSDGQILAVTLAVPYPDEADDPLYDIVTWQVINTQEWTLGNLQDLYRTGTESEPVKEQTEETN